MYTEPIWIRKQRALDPQTRGRLPLAVEQNADGCMLFSERYSGVCITAENTEAALARISDAVNAYRSWAEQRPICEQYVPIIAETYQTDAREPLNSRIIFACERRPLPAKTHARMKKEAIFSALCFAQLFNALPDADARLGDMDGRDCLRELRAYDRAVTAALGVAYPASGDFYADRVQVIRAMEQPGFMRNSVCTSDGEDWSYRKALRRMILADRAYARRLWCAAVREWGDETADPFGFKAEQPIKIL